MDSHPGEDEDRQFDVESLIDGDIPTGILVRVGLCSSRLRRNLVSEAAIVDH